MSGRGEQATAGGGGGGGVGGGAATTGAPTAAAAATVTAASGTAEAAPHNDVKLAGEESKERMYEAKHHKKIVRVLTVVAYVLSVSLAAIMLSLYYVFLWDPRSTRNVTRFTTAPPPSQQLHNAPVPSPTRCPDLVLPSGPPDHGLPGGGRGVLRPGDTTPSGMNELDLEDDGEVEPPRALPRSPSKENTAPAPPPPPNHLQKPHQGETPGTQGAPAA